MNHESPMIPLPPPNLAPKGHLKIVFMEVDLNNK